jgi:dinuclear metal center YbgI/SA1388 family protein
MPEVKDIRDFFNEKAPYYMKLDFDNVGMLVGFCQNNVTRVLTALDITDEVIEEAVALGAELIVSHHPLLFDAIKRVTDDDTKGKKIIRMLTNGISAICLHTNLDTADGGVNDALMHALGGRVTGLLDPHGTHPNGTPYGISRLGELDAPVDFFEFLANVKQSLNSNGLRYHYAGHPVHKLACCGGAGGMDIQKAYYAGCDTYVTADLKYDHFLWAKEFGLNLIDADHFCTENVVVPVIADMLKKQYPQLDVRISQVHGQTIQFF